MIDAQTISRQEATSRGTTADVAPGLRLLSRWAFVTTLAILGLFLVFVVGIGFAESDTAFGQDYAELMQAVRSPVLYHVAMALDAIAWLMIGGTLLIIAGLARRAATMATLFLAACAIGQLTGALGGFMRLDAVNLLAMRYTAGSPDQQALLRQSFLDVYSVIDSHFLAGQLLQGAGFLLAAWIAVSLVGMPRWVGFWLAFPGITSLTLFVLTAIQVDFFPLVLFHVLVAVGGLHVAVATRFWRGSTSLVSIRAGTAPG